MNRRAFAAAVATAVVAVVAVVALALSDDGGSDENAGRGFCDAVEAYDNASAEADVSAIIVSGDRSAADTGRVEERTRRAVSAAVGRLRSAASDIERQAPDVVDADVTLAMAADRRYYEALDDADYDLFALVGDPRIEVSEEELAAATRVEEYTQLECRVGLRPVVFNAADAIPSDPVAPTDPGGLVPPGQIPPTPPVDPRQPPTARPEPPPAPVPPPPPPDFSS